MKRVVLFGLSLLLVVASVMLAAPANAALNSEAPPVTLPACPGPAQALPPLPSGIPSTTLKLEPCVEVEYVADTATESVAVTPSDEPLEIKGMDALLWWLAVIGTCLGAIVGMMVGSTIGKFLIAR